MRLLNTLKTPRAGADSKGDKAKNTKFQRLRVPPSKGPVLNKILEAWCSHLQAVVSTDLAVLVGFIFENSCGWVAICEWISCNDGAEPERVIVTLGRLTARNNSKLPRSLLHRNWPGLFCFYT